MDKSKFIVILTIMLALFFVFGIEVEASSPAEIYSPSKTRTLLVQTQSALHQKVFHFYHSADGIAISDTGEYVTIGGGTAIIDMDINLGRGVIQNTSGIHIDTFEELMMNVSCDNEADIVYVDFDNGLGVMQQTLINAKPYIIVSGQKHYIIDEYTIGFEIYDATGSIAFQVGLELEMMFSYDATSVSEDSISTQFAKSTLTVTRNPMTFFLYGFNKISAGDVMIADKVDTQGNAITDALTNLFNRINTGFEEINRGISKLLINTDGIEGFIDEIEGYIDSLESWSASIFNRLNQGLVAIDSKFDTIISKLTTDYDTGTADSTNSSLSGSLDSWTAAEGQTIEDAQVEVVEYDTASAFNFAPALVSSLTLITSFSNAFFVASGDFSTALIVMIALVFVSVVVGLVRFVK